MSLEKQGGDILNWKCKYILKIWKNIYFRGFKKRAPRAIKEIRKFAFKMMGTEDVRLDTRLNKAIWAQGIRYKMVYFSRCIPCKYLAKSTPRQSYIATRIISLWLYQEHYLNVHHTREKLKSMRRLIIFIG